MLPYTESTPMILETALGYSVNVYENCNSVLKILCLYTYMHTYTYL